MTIYRKTIFKRFFSSLIRIEMIVVEVTQHDSTTIYVNIKFMLVRSMIVRKYDSKLNKGY